MILGAAHPKFDTPYAGGSGFDGNGEFVANVQVTPFVHNLSLADCAFLIQFCRRARCLDRHKLL